MQPLFLSEVVRTFKTIEGGGDSTDSHFIASLTLPCFEKRDWCGIKIIS